MLQCYPPVQLLILTFAVQGSHAPAAIAKTGIFCIMLQDSKARLQIEQRVAWARKFARINALALRKIAKKHDKLMHSRAGHVFLQVKARQLHATEYVCCMYLSDKHCRLLQPACTLQ